MAAAASCAPELLSLRLLDSARLAGCTASSMAHLDDAFLVHRKRTGMIGVVIVDA
jgi:hypothetical protein